MKNEKKKAFHEFCETLNRHSKYGYVFNKIKRFNNKFSKPSSYEGNKEILESMKECINEICAPSLQCNLSDRILNPQINNHFLTLPFDFSELTTALDNVNKKSAPGYDKINYEIIGKLPEFVKRTLLDIFNDVLHTGLFPEE